MKKLNKKGFTLVELLAVIVILAVIMVITIPTVLSSMSTATDSAFESAVSAVQKYIDDQTELCNAKLGDIATYEKSIFLTIDGKDTCQINSGMVTDIINKAGYSESISAITFGVEVDKCDTTTSDPGADSDDRCSVTVDGTTTYHSYSYKQSNKIASATGKGEFNGKSYPIS